LGYFFGCDLISYGLFFWFLVVSLFFVVYYLFCLFVFLSLFFFVG